MSQLKLPDSALEVAWFIQMWVKRPRLTPISYRFRRFVGCCPLGLVPMMTYASGFHSNTPTVNNAHNSTGLPRRSLNTFINWWDNHPDPQFAMDQIWPKEEA